MTQKLLILGALIALLAMPFTGCATAQKCPAGQKCSSGKKCCHAS